MKYYIQYTEDAEIKLQEFVSEKARDTFEKDFLRANQENSENVVNLIFEGNITFSLDNIKDQSDSSHELETNIELPFQVGDIVECVDMSGLKNITDLKLKLNSEYIVREVSTNSTMIDLTDLETGKYADCWYSRRFKLAKR